MDGSERDSDTTLGSWVSVSGNQENNVMSLGGSSSSSSADNSSNDNDPNPARHEHEMQVVDDTRQVEKIRRISMRVIQMTTMMRILKVAMGMAAAAHRVS